MKALKSCVIFLDKLMNKINRYLSIVLVLMLTHLYPAQAQNLQIDLDSVMQKALDISYDLRIAQVDVQINRTGIKAARADYYPELHVNANMEYLKGLQSVYNPVTAVGNTVLPTGTRFQNSVGMSLHQNLIDFGSRKRKVEMAVQDTTAKTSVYFQSLRDLRLKVIDLYTDALLAYKSLKANESLLQLARKDYQLKKKLSKAGTVSPVDVADEAIQVAQALDNIQYYKAQLNLKLEKLGFYTQETYDSETLDIQDLRDEPRIERVHFLPHQTPEAHMYDALLAQKQSEIEYLKRQYLPQVALYSYYSLYGSDQGRWAKALGNLSQRTVSMGLSINLPIFGGFKNQAAIEKAKLEKEKIRLQKASVIAQLKHQAKIYNSQIEDYSIQLQTKATILNKTQDKLTMVSRLSEQQVVDQSRAIKEHMERIKKQIEVEMSLIQGLAALKKLRILSGG